MVVTGVGWTVEEVGVGWAAVMGVGWAVEEVGVGV